MQFLGEYIVLVCGKTKVLLKRVEKGVKKRFSQTKKREKEDKTMNRGNRAFALTVVAIIAVFLLQSNLWGAAGQENPYELNPNASGTKYSGPLTVFFSEGTLDNIGNCIEGSSYVYFFVRLNKGMRYYTYAYDAGNLCNGYEFWVPAFQTFIEETLIPDICTTDSSLCPTFDNGRVALKSLTNNYERIYYDDEDNFMGCFIADIVIAVME
jgi:hypothetical protein